MAMTKEMAVKGLKRLRSDFSGYKPNEEMFDMAIEALLHEPKRGRWIIGNKTSVFDLEGVETWAVRMTCSECSFSLNFVEGHTAQYRFCPSCGARLESEYKVVGE